MKHTKNLTGYAGTCRNASNLLASIQSCRQSHKIPATECVGIAGVPSKNTTSYTIKLKVVSKETGKPFPALIRIFPEELAGQVKLSDPIAEIFSTGFSEVALPRGNYILRISHFSEIVPIEKAISVSRDCESELAAETWFDFRANGLFTGDCHNHVNFPENPENFCNFLRATGVDYISACQGWLTQDSSARGHDGKKLSAFLESLSTDDLAVRMGAEFPKTRFGHICWWKFPLLSDPYGCYNDYHDSSYFMIAGISSEKCEKPSEQIPFSSEAPVFKLKRWKDMGGISMLPHPTSWWRNRSDSTLIATNIGADICFDLLVGRLYDTMAIMGYDAEHVFYQNLWFKLLNLGYRIPAVAETDGGIRGKHLIGSLRTYAHCGGKSFKEKSFLKAISSGRSFLTSGPVILAKADGRHLPGTVINHKGGKHEISMDVMSSPASDEYISWIVIYKDGRPCKIIDIEKKKLKRYSCNFFFPLSKTSRCWFIVKAYGKRRPKTKAFADIIKYAALCEKETHAEYRELDQVAFTNPFYFVPQGYSEPARITPPLKGRISDSVTGKPLEHAQIKLVVPDEKYRSISSGKNGGYSIKRISLLSGIEISARGYDTKIVSIYADYPPLKEYFEHIYSGKWANSNRKLQPGQVPWKVFDFPKIKRILSSLKWNFELSPEK